MSETAPPAPRNSDLPTRFAAGVVMIAVAVVVTYLSGWPFRVLAALAAAVMLLEWADMHRVKRLWTWLAIAVLTAILVAVAEYWFPAAASNPVTVFPDYFDGLTYGAAAVAGGALAIAILSRRLSMGWGFLYIGLPAFALVALNWLWAELVLWLFITVWSTDILAYFTGRAIGGAKLAPRTSPNKTWAGLVGGLIGAAVFGAAAAYLLNVDPIFLYIGAPIGLLAQLGDLYESAVKRRAGVKDSGRILPGHGGVLDRLDGLLPAALATLAVYAAVTLGAS